MLAANGLELETEQGLRLFVSVPVVALAVLSPLVDFGVLRATRGDEVPYLALRARLWAKVHIVAVAVFVAVMLPQWLTPT